jgi:hypothetical protein
MLATNLAMSGNPRKTIAGFVPVCQKATIYMARITALINSRRPGAKPTAAVLGNNNFKLVTNLLKRVAIL